MVIARWLACVSARAWLAAFVQLLSGIACDRIHCLRDQVPWVSVPLGAFHLQWGIVVPHTPMAPACSLGITLSPAVNRDCNGVLNCPWYHGCSESKHGFVAACRCVCFACLLFMRRSGLGGSFVPLLTNPRGRGWVGECSMLAQCELRHNVVVSPHTVGMLHSFDCCGRRCFAADEKSSAEISAEWCCQRLRRIRLASHSSVCLA